MAIYPDDPVRAMVEERAQALGLDLTNLSRAINANGSYLQQFLRRGTPRALPEDKRELLAPLLGVAPDDLRGAAPGKGAPRPAETDAIAINADEAAWLRLFRQLPAEKRPLAVGLVKVLSS
jgi:hypothetical protein